MASEPAPAAAALKQRGSTGARVLAGAKLGVSGRAAAILTEKKEERINGSSPLPTQTQQTLQKGAEGAAAAGGSDTPKSKQQKPRQQQQQQESARRSPSMKLDGLKMITVPGRGAVVKQTRAAKLHEQKEDKSGLRTVAQQLIERMEKYKTKPFIDMANELVADLETPKLDGKNIRKRVYDAVNVLTAMQILTKEGKDITWRGMPVQPHSSELAQLLQETRQLRESIEGAEMKLADLNSRTAQYQALIERNASRRGQPEQPDASEVIQIPFVVVRTPKESQIMCEFVDDHTLYSFDFNQPFEMQDDAEILKRMLQAGIISSPADSAASAANAVSVASSSSGAIPAAAAGPESALAQAAHAGRSVAAPIDVAMSDREIVDDSIDMGGDVADHAL